MNLEISPDLAELRTTLRRFATTTLEPIALEIDRTGEIPDAATEAMRAHGYLGLGLPTEYGGQGLDLAAFCLTMEEFSRSHRVFTLILEGTTGFVPHAILRFGTDAQRSRYLRPMVEGRLASAFALTEPGAGSDSQAITTRAERRDGKWVINGRKHYISGAHKSDVTMVMAVNDPAKRSRGGITAFLVDRGTPGMHVTRVDTTMGSDAIKLAELTFEDCVVPDDAVLGEVGEGFRIAMSSLMRGRMGVSCSCIGVADRLIEMSTKHAKSRSTFGKPLGERQAIQWMLADSATELAMARALTYETLRRAAANEDTGTMPAMCKLACSEMVGRVADRAVQVHGGAGIVSGYPVERFYRDIRHYRIGEGSSEVQRMLISRGLLQ